jgi:hypothetical protein
MAEAIGKLIGFLLLAGLVIGLVCLAVALAIVAAVIVGPCVLSGYWLRNHVQRFELSRTKVWECVILGLVLFCLPMLVLLADTSVWPMALWTSSTLGLAGPALYLTIEAYRQVFWPHRKVALAESMTARRLRWSLWARHLRLNSLEKAIRREDQRHGGLRHELGQMRALTREVVLRTDPAFFSAEVTRWSRAYAAMADEALEQHAAALPAGTVLKSLERALERLPEISRNEPGQVRQLLQAAIAYSEVLARMVGGRNDEHEANIREVQRLRSEIDALQIKRTAAQDNRTKATETIRQLRKERVAVQ